MDLLNEFVVPLKIEDAWTLLTDVGKIAPCMPGAILTENNGHTFKGSIHLKIGPVTSLFIGSATFIEKDSSKYRAVLQIEGRDTKGNGFANGTITATLFPRGDFSSVTIQSKLTISGRIAQFGRDVVGDISTKLFNQFVACLEYDILSGGNNG